MLLGVFIAGFSIIGLILGLSVPFGLNLFYIAFCCLLIFLLKNKGLLNSKILFLTILFVISFGFRLAFIFTVDTPPASDYRLMFDAAIKFSQGDYSFSEHVYFQEWAYQTGFVIYQGTVIKIFGTGNALIVLKILNALFSSFSCILIYILVKGLLKDDSEEEMTARLSALFSAGLIFPITFVTVLTNQHISTFFILLALYFINHTGIKEIYRHILGGFFLAISNILRPEGIIIVGSLLIFNIINLLKSDKKKRMKALGNMAVILIVYFGINMFASKAVVHYGINQEGLKNNNPLWKVVVGLNYESKGNYSEKDEYLIYNGKNTREERKELQISLIKERLKMGPKKLIGLLITKQYSLWSGNPIYWSFQHLKNSDYSIEISGNNLSYDEIIALFHHYHKAQILTLVLLTLAGAFLQFRYPPGKEMLLYYLILLATAGAYLIIEVQPRYVYLPETILSITSALGIKLILKIKNNLRLPFKL